MAKKARTRPKAKKAKRAKARARPRAKKAVRGKARRKPNKVGSAFQVMIDTINETERMREKREPPGSDETA
jgi:hypothetical protein